MKALLIIPTYNEIKNIDRIIRTVLSKAKDLEVLVMDDNSPDGTADAVKALMQSESRVHIIERPGKMGLGSAYVTGFKYALDQGYEFILEMDADFSHNPDDVPRLLEAAQKYDLVIGSRYSNGVNIVNWPFKRLMISYFASKYVRIITGMPITDPTGAVISWASSGEVGFKGSRKSTPFAAQMAAEAAAKRAQEHGMRKVDVFVKGPGSGRETAIRALQATGLEVGSIQDVTPSAHNGCRPPKRRRV